MKNTKYFFMLFGATLIFGVTFIPVKMLMNAHYPVFFLLALRFSIAAGMLWAVKLIKPCPITRQEVTKGLMVGVFVLAGFILQTMGARYTTPAKSGLYTGMYVIFVPIITMIFRRKFQVKPLIVSLICFFGVALVSDVFSEISYNLGDFFTTLCGISFAFQIFYLSHYAPKLNPVNFTLIQFLVVAAVSFVISLFTETSQYATLGFDQNLLIAILLGIIPTGIAMLAQTYAQAKLSANISSVIICMEVVFALLASAVLGYDTLTLTLTLGSAVMVGSMVIAAYSPASKSSIK